VGPAEEDDDDDERVGREEIWRNAGTEKNPLDKIPQTNHSRTVESSSLMNSAPGTKAPTAHVFHVFLCFSTVKIDFRGGRILIRGILS